MMVIKSEYKKCRSVLKIVLCIIIIVVLMEWLEYALSPFFWPKFPTDFLNSIKILIVGDPQLLGYTFSWPGILGFICRWDADRYISKTFSAAYHYVQPDLVILLGDNLDEGEIAKDEEFHEYIKRFRHVFQDVDFHKAIIVPGDNDIGGEDRPPSPELEKRFDMYFREDVFLKFKFLEFVKVNYISHSNDYQLAPNITSENTFRIILTHIPLTPLYSTFASRVIPYVKPDIILSAHDHKYGHWISDKETGLSASLASDSDFFKFNMTESHIHEIIVPTCSYRMGTPKMAYGALQLSPGGEAYYSVLWLPSRFRQLFIYLFCIICLSLYLMSMFLRASFRSSFYQQRSPFIPQF